MRRARPYAVLLLMVCCSAAAWADPVDCAVTPGALSCRLQHWLHVLHWAVGFMVLALVVVAGLAYAVYRRNRTAKILPDET